MNIQLKSLPEIQRKKKIISFVFALCFMRKETNDYLAVSLVHNKWTNIIGFSDHQTRRECICSLFRRKTFQAFPFSWCSTGTEHLQMPAHKEMPSSQRRKRQCYHQGKWQGTTLLDVRKKPLLSLFVVEQLIHVYLNEKCVWGKKETSLGLHCNISRKWGRSPSCPLGRSNFGQHLIPCACRKYTINFTQTENLDGGLECRTPPTYR